MSEFRAKVDEFLAISTERRRIESEIDRLETELKATEEKETALIGELEDMADDLKLGDQILLDGPRVLYLEGKHTTVSDLSEIP